MWNNLGLFVTHVRVPCRSRARSIGLFRIRRTHPFSDDAFDWAQLNLDESSELIRLIRKFTDEFG